MSQELVVVGGGAGGGTPRSPITAEDTLQSRSIVEFIEGISEGEIEGFATVEPLESVYLDDTPVMSNGELNFEGVSLDYRLGTQDQTYIPAGEMSLEENASAAIEYSVENTIEAALPVVRTISSLIADAVRLRIRVDALWYRDVETGDVSGSEVEIKIEIKGSGGSYVDASPPQVLTVYQISETPSIQIRLGPTIFKGKASSAYERSFTLNLKDYGSPPYDIRITRLTPDSPTDGLWADTVNWVAYTELVYAKLRYPNTAHARLTFDSRSFSRIPSRGFLLKGIKVRVPGPAFYDPVTRTYTGVDWDGSFVTAWTRCPAWIFYDMITDERYGLGKEVNEQYVDKWNLWSIAKRCDALVDDGFNGLEPRYSLDLYLQVDADAKKIIQDIASNFSAMAYWHTGGVFLAQDAIKPVSALYTPANVIDGRFNYAGSARQVRHTVALVEWNDPDDFYKIATEYIEDRDGIDRYGYRETKVVAVGCTSRGQAHRAGKSALLTARMETDVVSFSVGLSGLVNKPGDIVRVADPLKSGDKRLGGRVASGSDSSTVNVDADVIIDAGQSYTLCLVMPDGSVETGVVTNVAGTYTSVSVSPSLSAAPDTGAIWSLYSGAIPSREYRVLWITENNEADGGFYQISAATYNPAKYALIEDGLRLQQIYKPPFARGYIEPPTNITVTNVSSADDFGIITHLDVSWTPSVNRFVTEHELTWQVDNGQVHYITNIVGSSYRIENAVAGEYNFKIRAKSIAGSTSQIINNYYTLLPLYAINAVNITNMGVRGIGTEFFGKNAEFSWETDADTSIGVASGYSNGSGGSSQWFRDFQVQVYDGATLLRTEYVTEFSYVYTFDKNIEDNSKPIRTVTIKVVARNQFGKLSQEGVFTATNNPPAGFPSIELLPSEGSLVIKFDDPVDVDYSYIRIFGSQTQGFTPDDTPGTGNLIWSGSDNYITIPIESQYAGQWYLRAQLVDEFGLSGTVYTPEVAQQVFAATAQLDPVVAADITRVITDFDASNNRDGSAITAPTVLSDGTAIDHTLNPDGTVDVSFEWAWVGDESTLDGFAIYVHASGSSAPYSFTGFSSTEMVFQVPAYSRTYIWRGVPAQYYYSIAVVAYRKVDSDIAANGLIYSALARSTHVSEHPYHPPSIDPASGDITTTINGILSQHVNVWNQVTGAGRPFDNADVTLDQISGSGINIVHGEYSIVNASEVPPAVDFNGTTTLDATQQFFKQASIKLAATGSNAQLYLSANTTDYNILLTPNKKWIISAYVRGSVANASGQLYLRTIAGGAYYSVNFLTSAIAGEWTRVSGEIDLSADGSDMALMRVDNDAGVGQDVWFQALMLEEMVGTIVAPSAYARPATTTVNGVYLADAAGAAINYSNSNDNNGLAIVAPSFATNGTAIEHETNTDGSVDITVTWGFSGVQADIDGFAVMTYATGTNHGGGYVLGTNPNSEVAFIVPAYKRSHVFLGVPANNYYTVALVAYRNVNTDINAAGIILSPNAYMTAGGERPYRPSPVVAFLGDLTGTIEGVAASGVVSNAAEGNAAFLGTAQYRTPGAPTNSPVPTTGTVTHNTIGGRDIRLAWAQYSQGVVKADFLVLFAREGIGALSVNDAAIQFNLNTTGASYYIYQNVDTQKSYTAGIAAGRNTDTGVQIGPIQTILAWAIPVGVGINDATSVPWSGVNNDNGSAPADNADVTANNTAAAISGQGALATRNNVGSNQVLPGAINAVHTAIAAIDASTGNVAASQVTAISAMFSTVSALSSNLGTINAGTIDTTGYMAADGQVSTVYGDASILGNKSGSAQNGVVGIGSSSGVGVYGGGPNIGVNGIGKTGVYGASVSSGGYAVRGVGGFSAGGVYASAVSGIALYVSGTMQITSSSKVSNLNADMVDGYHVSSGTNGVPINNGSLNANLNAGYLGGLDKNDFCQRINASSGTAYPSSSGALAIVSTVSGVTTSGSGATVTIKSSSDRRLKKQIKKEVLGLDFINSLSPVTYRWKDKKMDGIVHHGFISQDFERQFSGTDDGLYQQYDDGMLGTDYMSLIAPLSKAIQELSIKVDRLSLENKQLKKDKKHG